MIGHEISHGFDDQGRKSDGNGNLRDWWTADDARQFEERATKLGAQFEAYTPMAGMKINGQQTMGENIGDLSGLAVAFRAYKMSLNGKTSPVIGGFTGEQRFFLGWAQVWRFKSREEALRNQLLRGAEVTHGLTSAAPGLGLHGMGGMGKSVMAQAVCHDTQLRQAFADGIAWITLGQQPDLLALQNRLLHVLEPKAPPAEKWAGVAWSERGGLPAIDDALLWVACDLRDVIAAGDHVILTGEVRELETVEGDPLVFQGGEYRPQRPEGVPSDDWLRWEQAKHERLLATTSTTRLTETTPA